MSKSVLLIIAQNQFSDDEHRRLRGFFESRSYDVITAGQTRNIATSTLEQALHPDRALAEINSVDFDVLIVVGGPGATAYLEDEVALQLLRDFMRRPETAVGAIGHGVVLLAEAGLLIGKDATGKPAHEEYLKNRGATYTGMPLVIDGRIVTAKEKTDIDVFARAVHTILER